MGIYDVELFWGSLEQLHGSFSDIDAHQNFQRAMSKADWSNDSYIKCDRSNFVVVFMFTGSKKITYLQNYSAKKNLINYYPHVDNVRYYRRGVGDDEV